MSTYQLRQRLKLVANLPEVNGVIRAECRIAHEDLNDELKRHAEQIKLIEERFNRECWRHVSTHWNETELREAASVQTPFPE